MQTFGNKEREIQMHKLICIAYINILCVLVSRIRKQRKIKLLTFRDEWEWGAMNKYGVRFL